MQVLCTSYHNSSRTEPNYSLQQHEDGVRYCCCCCAERFVSAAIIHTAAVALLLVVSVWYFVHGKQSNTAHSTRADSPTTMRLREGTMFCLLYARPASSSCLPNSERRRQHSSWQRTRPCEQNSHLQMPPSNHQHATQQVGVGARGIRGSAKRSSSSSSSRYS